MLHFEATTEQRNALEGLAYWIAQKAACKEKYSNKDVAYMENLRIDRTIKESILPECDKLKIPFWVQNSVICWAENWRNYAGKYMSVEMAKKKNIIL